MECSAGAACVSAVQEPSHVLLAMGAPPELAIGSVRLTIGADVSEDDIGYVIERLPPLVRRLRAKGARTLP